MKKPEFLIPGFLAIRQHHVTAITVLLMSLPPLFFFGVSSGFGEWILFVPSRIHTGHGTLELTNQSKKCNIIRLI